MSDAPQTSPTPTSLADLPRGESQWRMILREFRKRRLAVASYWILIALACVAIFAPFLANDRPVAYLGFNRSEFDRARTVARALVGQLLTPPLDDRGQPLQLDAERVRESVLTRFVQMQRQLAPASAAVVAQLAVEFQSALSDGSRESLQAVHEKLSKLTSRDVDFAIRWRSPVLASLDGLDVAFLVLAVLFLGTSPVRALARRRWGQTPRPLHRTLVALLLAVPPLVGLAWHLLVPKLNDLTPYKEGVLASAEPAVLRRAPVMYQVVIWPAIPYGLDENRLEEVRRPPWWWPNQERAKPRGESSAALNGLPPHLPHWLGTDSLGRDLACRMIWGGRVSLAVGVVAVAIYVTIGVLVGALAGYFRGWVDLVISRIIEVVICFPSFFLILAIVAFVGPSMFVIMVVIGLTSWTGVARLVRAEFLRLSEQEFVLAGRVLGYHPLRLIFRHILPNALAPVLVSATFGVAGAILIESALSFLGLGITVPKPSWGGILSDGRSAIFSAQWIIIFPGLAIFLTITCYNLVGEAFRDAADPRLRGSR